MTDFGTVLREKRRVSGLSQRQLADRAGLDFSYISKLENGRLPPPAADTAVRLADILGCPAEDLLSAAKKMPTGFSDSLADPAAIRFLQEASRLRLSQDEWEQLLGKLQGLRSDEEYATLRYSHSYSKRGTLDSCLRKYFFEYYAAAKKLPFDAERKELVRGLKEFTGMYMLAGEILHWFIEQYLKKGSSVHRWAERTALDRFNQAVRYSRDPVRMAHMRDVKYPPPMLMEFYYQDPRADELASSARQSLQRGISNFLNEADIGRAVETDHCRGALGREAGQQAAENQRLRDRWTDRSGGPDVRGRQDRGLEARSPGWGP